MSSGYGNLFFDVQPFEESQGSPITPVSPDELTQFYVDMEKKENNQRKLSKASKSRWPTMSLRKASGGKPAGDASESPVESSEMSRINTESEEARKTSEKEETERVLTMEEEMAQDQSQAMPAQSMVPETAAWSEEQLRTISAPKYKTKYYIHNPIGPRWYTNIHLTPPSQIQRTTSRPPSSLAPSFPHNTMIIAKSEDVVQPPGAGPSRSPSGSPLPTPNSSQVLVIPETSIAVRARKISLTAHDEVDLWDSTDPSGTNWHHQSPYDVGLNPNRNNEHARSGNEVELNSRLTPVKRPTPSPLSQSTSAVHLQLPAPSENSHSSRKLSKRHKNGILGLFGSQMDLQGDGAPMQQSVSAPTSAVDDHLNPWNAPADGAVSGGVTRKLSKSGTEIMPSASMSSAPSSISGPYPLRVTDRKEKRGSYFGRIAKKFSIARRPLYSGPGGVFSGRASEDWQRVDASDASITRPAISSQTHSHSHSHQSDHTPAHLPPLSSSPTKSSGDSKKQKRVPPPSVDDVAIPNEPPPSQPSKKESRHRRGDRSSASTSLMEAPFSIGTLMIANPDTGSATSTPAKAHAPLPVETETHPATTTDGLSKKRREETPEPLSQPSPHLPPPQSPPPDALVVPPVLTVRNSFEGEPSYSRPDLPKEPESPPQPQSRLQLQLQPQQEHHPLPTPPPPEPYINASNTTWPLVNSTSLTQSPGSSVLAWPSTEGADSRRVSAAAPFSRYGNGDWVNDSPLSKASLLVNPPTPYMPSVEIPAPPPKAPVPVHPQNGYGTGGKDHKAPYVKPPSPMDTTRQTETFRLVRSSSGRLQPNDETISALGEQWGVVESPDKRKGRERSTSKDGRGSDTQTRHNSSSIKKGTDSTLMVPGAAETPSRRHAQRRSSWDDTSRSTPPRVPPKHSMSQRDKDRGASEKKQGDAWYTPAPARGSSTEARSTSNMNKPQPPRPPPTPAPELVQAERRGPRPISDVPSTNDPASMKAWEAWEAERLWKGRSGVYGSEATRFVSTPPFGRDVPSGLPAVQPGVHRFPSNTNTVHSTSHGSSHTSFMVQAPHQGHAPQAAYFYSPTPPAPVFYHSISQQQPQQLYIISPRRFR